MRLNEIRDRYIRKDHRETTTRENLRNRIQKLQQRLDNLKYVSWVDELLEPIAKELIKMMPGYDTYEILGPFGLRSETGIHFYEKNHQGNTHHCKSINIVPGDLDKGELKLVDYSKDTGRYREGSLGEINGYNHPDKPLPNTIKGILKEVK